MLRNIDAGKEGGQRETGKAREEETYKSSQKHREREWEIEKESSLS